MIATAAIGALYHILQLPLAAYYGATEKRLFGGKFLPEFDFYADKAIALLLASGAGAGFAVSYELKKFVPFALLSIAAFAQASGDGDSAAAAEEEAEKIPGFLNRGYIACGVLLAGCVFMTIVSVLSSINRTK